MRWEGGRKKKSSHREAENLKVKELSVPSLE